MEDIFKLLIQNSETNRNSYYCSSLKKHLIEAVIFAVIICLNILGILHYQSEFKFSINSFAYLSFISLMIGIFYVIVKKQAIDLFVVIRNPTKSMLEPIAEAAKEQQQLTEKLVNFHVTELELAINRISYDIKRMKFRIGIIVGAVERLGIIPFAVALYFSILKFIETQIMGVGYIIGLAFIGGIYLGVLLCSNILQRLDYYLLVLRSAKEIAEKKASLQVPLKEKINRITSVRHQPLI